MRIPSCFAGVGRRSGCNGPAFVPLSEPASTIRSCHVAVFGSTRNYWDNFHPRSARFLHISNGQETAVPAPSVSKRRKSANVNSRLCREARIACHRAALRQPWAAAARWPSSRGCTARSGWRYRRSCEGDAGGLRFLQWDVAVLFAGIGVALVFQGAEGGDDAGASFGRFDHGVDVAAFGGNEGICEAFAEFGDFFLA